MLSMGTPIASRSQDLLTSGMYTPRQNMLEVYALLTHLHACATRPLTANSTPMVWLPRTMCCPDSFSWLACFAPASHLLQRALHRCQQSHLCTACSIDSDALGPQPCWPTRGLREHKHAFAACVRRSAQPHRVLQHGKKGCQGHKDSCTSCNAGSATCTQSWCLLNYHSVSRWSSQECKLLAQHWEAYRRTPRRAILRTHGCRHQDRSMMCTARACCMRCRWPLRTFIGHSADRHWRACALAGLS